MDVTVPFETKYSIQQAARTKLTEFLSALQTVDRLSIQHAEEVTPVVVGAVPQSTVIALGRLDLNSRQSIRDIALVAFEHLRLALRFQECKSLVIGVNWPVTIIVLGLYLRPRFLQPTFP